VSETLILSNSLGTTRELWFPQLPAFEARYRVLRYEHRARTTIAALASDVLALLDESGVERASFCGISIGGAVGMWLAATAPERIERLVLACTSARFGAPEAWQERAALVRAEGTAPLVDVTMGRWFTSRFHDREPFRRMLLAARRDDYAAGCEALAAWDFRERLGEIRAPTLVIAGEEDPVTPPAHAELLVAGIPASRMLVLPACGHLASVEQATAFTDAVLDHLAQEVSA
jgi:3-oxoadipate enol-lactonase